MAESPDSILDAVAKELPRFFRDTVDQISDGEAIYLRDGTPESTISQIGQAVGRSACRRFGTNSNTLTPEASTRFERACRPYLDSIDPGNGGTIGIPFEGGQCACSVYRYQGAVVGTSDQFGTPYSIPFDFRLRGPTTGWRRTGNPGWILTSRGRNNFSQGVVPGCTSTPVNVSSGPAFLSSDSRIAGEGLTLLSGADNCGGPLVRTEPRRRQTDPQPPPFRFNPGPGIDVPITVNVNNNGDIIVNIGGGTRTVPTGDPAPAPPGGGSGLPPGDIGSPATPSTTGDGGESEGEAPSGSVLVGVKLDILASPPSATRYTPDVFRGALYAYMGVPGNLDQDYGGSMVRSGQFLFAEKENLTAWRVSANTGYNIRTTPYYREA